MDNNCLCTLCSQPLQESEDLVNVQRKGLNTFIEKSKAKQDNKWKHWDGRSSITFHTACRKRYSASSSNPPKKRKSESPASESALPSHKKRKSLENNEPSAYDSSTKNAPTAESSSIPSLTSDFKFSDSCFICGKLLDPIH